MSSNLVQQTACSISTHCSKSVPKMRQIQLQTREQVGMNIVGGAYQRPSGVFARNTHSSHVTVTSCPTSSGIDRGHFEVMHDGCAAGAARCLSISHPSLSLLQALHGRECQVRTVSQASSSREGHVHNVWSSLQCKCVCTLITVLCHVITFNSILLTIPTICRLRTI